MPHAEANGISLHYEDTGEGTGPATSPRGLPPLLLLHELGGSAASWGDAIPALSAGRRVIAMDARGAGRSEVPVRPFALEALADDAAALLGSLGVERADVAGAALGSLVALLLAARHTGLVRRLALFAVADDMGGETAAYLTERAERVLRTGMRPVADASLANAFVGTSPGTSPGASPGAFAAARERYRPRFLANSPAGYAALSLALARARFGDDIWRAVRSPALVVSGAHDFIWPPAKGRQVADRLADARFEVLADSGHFPHLQTPAAVAAAVERFFPPDGVL